MGMKTLPKAILILAVVSGFGFGLAHVDFKSLTRKDPAEIIKSDAVLVVPSTAEKILPPTVSAPMAPDSAASTPGSLTPPATTSSNVTSGDAGLNAVLGAGKK